MSHIRLVVGLEAEGAVDGFVGHGTGGCVKPSLFIFLVLLLLAEGVAEGADRYGHDLLCLLMPHPSVGTKPVNDSGTVMALVGIDG